MPSPVAVLLLVAMVVATPVAAQATGYRLPPDEIVAILDAPPEPSVSFSPDAAFMLLAERPAMPTIADVMRPWVGLAGMRVDPVLRSRRTVDFVRRVSVQDTAGGAARPLALPDDARVVDWTWSPDGTRVAFVLAGDAGLQLWMADVATGACRFVRDGLCAVLGGAVQFAPDGASLWLTLVPEGAAPPSTPSVPAGPVVQESSGTSTPLRTYQDLLDGPEAEDLFENLATSQLARLHLADGRIERIGAPALHTRIDPSPDGRFLLVERLRRPFSYVLPYSLFPAVISVLHADGRSAHTVAQVPLGEHIPMEGVRTGPRLVQWRDNAPATLVWAEAQDGGDPSRAADVRDHWYTLAAPFDGEPTILAVLAHRARGVSWMSASERCLVGEYDRDRRWNRTWMYDLGASDAAPILVEDRSRNDRYGDPGSPLTVPSAFGITRVVFEDEAGRIFRAGPGHSPNGPRPFLARCDLAAGTSERLWESDVERYESVTLLARHDADVPAVITTSESPTEPPNYQWRDVAAGTSRALTHFTDPTPQIRDIHQERLTYTRADGVALSATLYLPADYEPGTRLPLVVWAYPLEFTDPTTAGQVASSTTRALRMRGATHLALLTQGYAILDNATMPVVGDPETVNDTFVQQIVDSAAAAIDAAVERGVADRDRVVVGGHSYGAFMTAHLLAHSDLFRAGIARSGAYNRTLTPFGFQSERRTLWEAPDSYVGLSPFFAAHKINEPLLMIHGEEDSNSGTYPMQSERMYQAVKGNGGSVRLVMLPGEDHGYRARESVLHTLAEMLDWCERHTGRDGL